MILLIASIYYYPDNCHIGRRPATAGIGTGWHTQRQILGFRKRLPQGEGGAMLKEHIYCVFCETRREAKVQEALRKLGFCILPAAAERTVFRRKKKTIELRPLLPGYVFLQHSREPDWKQICSLNYVYYILKYSDNSKALRGKDLEFVRWIMRRSGVIEISKAVRVGTKVVIVDGPLKEWEGNIVKVNSRSKYAEVRIDMKGFIHTIWLSFEVIKTRENEI